MKAFPIFIENSPLYQMLASETIFQDRMSLSETQRLLRIRKKYGLDTELRRGKKNK